MKKKDIMSFILETAKKFNDADGIPLDICDDFRCCIAMIQNINRVEFITVRREFSIDKKDMDKVPESATLSGVHPQENIYKKPDA
tara:strand:- start:193 stop:447 length:255 start_codon:yes stop_codon:yes gene_type:complete